MKLKRTQISSTKERTDHTLLLFHRWKLISRLKLEFPSCKASKGLVWTTGRFFISQNSKSTVSSTKENEKRGEKGWNYDKISWLLIHACNCVFACYRIFARQPSGKVHERVFVSRYTNAPFRIFCTHIP